MTDFRVVPVEEMIHGVMVQDHYRWLEDRTLPETEAWVEEQQRRCKEYFAACGDLHSLQNRVRQYLDVEIIDQSTRVAGKYFYRRRGRGDEQGAIYVRDASSGPERLLVDTSAMGPFFSVGIYRISRDGSLLAYELKRSGEDRKSIHLVDVPSGHLLTDKVDAGYARGFAFTQDSKGFYYCHETSPDPKGHLIRRHLLGGSETDQAVLCMARTRDSRLILTADSIHLGAIWIHGHPSVADLWVAARDKQEVWHNVFADRRLPYSPFLRNGRIFVLADVNAPNGKLIELALDGNELGTIIPEQNGTIRHLAFVRDEIFVNYLHDLVPSIRHWSLEGTELGNLDIPVDGTVQFMPNYGESESLFYIYESFTEAPAVFEYESERATSQLWHRRDAPNGSTRRSMRRIGFRSKDGTAIPMTLIEVPGRDPRVRGPVILTGYGGFGVPVTPQFSVLASMMMELGAIFALPNIRGGGDFGKAWHDAGRGLNRQTAYDDFIAAAEWLCKEGLTSPQQLAVFGGSNSGLLVGAAMTQRPDLFRAVLCIAPLLDMVRYEQFDQSTKWRHEFGTVRDEESFHALLAYSPYHHVKDGTSYPAALFVSGDMDDRCNPMHARKMAARLQDNPAQTRTILLDYSRERGHSPVLPLTVRVEALVRRIAFLCRELSISYATGELL